MKKIARLVAFIVLVFTSYNAHSQDFSNKGTEFWLAYSYHVGMNGGGDPAMTLYLTSDVNTTFTVEIFGVTTIQSGSITAGQVVTVNIPTTYYAANGFNFWGYINNKAIHVTSVQPIVVYSYISRSAASGATLCLPTNVLGKEYYSANFTQRSNEQSSNGYITIVAAEDNTTIDITTLVSTVNWPAPGTYQITLNKGQIYQVLGTVSGLNGVDLTGTKIKSVSGGSGGCKRIAVFSGSGKIYIFNGSCGNNSADNLYQQLYPTGSWGQKYLTVPSNGRPYNIYRITKNDPSTIVTVNGAIIPSTSFTSNIYYEFSNTIPNRIEADKPISVAQYFTTSGCNANGSPYDPDMIMLNPVEQNINKVTLVSSNLYATGPQHHIHVIMRNGGTGRSSFTLDGAAIPVGSWVQHPNDPNYSYLYLTNVSQGYHKIASDSGFNALAYGYANAESYGYSAGANVKDLYQFVTIQNEYAQVDYPSTCKGAPFRFSMTFPYQPSSITWDFGGLFPNVINNSPVYDSSWIVNGKTLYKYKLTGNYTLNTVGTFPIKVIAQNPTPDGCSGTQEIPYELKVLERPTANFSFNTNGCFTSPVTFTDLSNPNGTVISAWHWDFGDGTGTASVKNPSYTYPAGGSYMAKLHIVTDVGCISDTIPLPVSVTEAPVADFTISTPGCVDKPVTFTDASGSAGSPIVKWTWNFGDGSPQVISTTNAPQTHVYTTQLNYTVTLKVETASGCQSVIRSKPLDVYSRLTASFDFGNACLPGGQMQFTNTTQIGQTPPFNIAACNWTFSDGGTSTNCNPVHTYTSTGSFTATLTVTSDVGCTDDTTRTVTTIYNPAVASFTVDKEKTCVNTDFNFTGSSTAPGNTVQQWNWDFGDGTTSTQQNPAKPFSTPGTFYIKHWIRTAAGCVSDTARDTLVVFSRPIASFVVDPHRCEKDTLYFTSNSTAGGANITLYNWQVNGTPLIAVGNSAKYLPPTATSYAVRLSIGTEASCTDDSIINVVVNPKPVPAFNLPNVCLPTGAATFINTTTIPDGSAASIGYIWNFGDPSATGSNPNSSTQKDGSHFYASTGNYPVKLTATSNNGCIKDTIRNLITVYDPPVASFTAPVEVCHGTQVGFTDNSTAPNNSVTQWNWSFDDGTSSNQQNPVKTFATPGSHSATLTVTSQAGCVSAPVAKNVQVNRLPVSSFAINGTTCETRNINFVNQSVANSGTIVKWTWNMGTTGSVDTVRTTGAPFTYVYSSAGQYHVTLVTETNKGCISAKLDTIINVYPQPNPGFAMSENCLRDPYSEFTDTSSIADNSEASFTYVWNFGDPNANASNPNTASGAVPQPRHIYTMITTYPVTMTVTSNRGCFATLQQQFTINGSVPQSNFSITGSNHCSNDSLRFVNNSFADVGSIVKLEIFWDNANNPTVKETDQFPAIGKIYSHLYPEFFTPATKNYSIRVVAYSGDACLKDSIITITLRATPDVNFTALEDACANDAGYIINAGSANNMAVIGGGGVYSGNGISPTGNFSPATAGSGTHTMRYTFTGTNGCTNFKEQPLVVFPVPTGTAGPDKLVLEGGLDTLDGAGTGNNVSFLWSPNRWLSSNAVAKPKVTPLDDITYTLTVTSADGCSVSDNVLVKVLKAPTVPNVFTPNSDGVNDKWEIQYLETYPGATIEVYNRYGQLVFRSVGYTKPWDGKVNGTLVPVGTYYYIINPKNGRRQVTGFVDIIR